MDTRLIVLKLILDEFGVSAGDETGDDVVQEVIRDMQESGLDIGYHFMRLSVGYRSMSLAHDYALLVEELGSGDRSCDAMKLRDDVREHIGEILNTRVGKAETSPVIQRDQLLVLLVKLWDLVEYLPEPIVQSALRHWKQEDERLLVVALEQGRVLLREGKSSR